MAAPVATARSTPAGIPLGDGFSTLITFAADVDISFWEKSVQPPGVDGGDAVKTSTMHNTAYSTMRSRTLKTLTEAKCTAAYDPVVLDQIVALVNVETTVTVTFPDGSTWAFFGFLQKFEPSENEEGEQPEADITVICTNWDPANNVEAGPTVVEVAGT